MNPAEVLQPTPNCPWCGSTRRTSSRAFTSKPNRYLAAVAEEVRTTPEALIEKMTAVECQNCGTSYCDPWLSPAATRWLFSLGYPQHNAAWKAFYQWLDRTPDFEAKVLPRKEKIWRHVRDRIGLVRRYGEIGCPFMGLLAYFQSGRRTAAESFTKFQDIHRRQNAPPRHPTFMPSLFPVEQAMLRIRSWKNRRRWPSQTLASPDPSSFPSDVWFIRSPSRLLWGANCSSLGTSCAATALAHFSANIMELNDLDSSFDLLALFNTLDHQDKPARVLEKAMACARFVLIELHRDQQAGKQHLYVINEALARTARQRGWKLEDFSKIVDQEEHDCLYLLSREQASPNC